jgi:hypothetical protein
MAIPGNWSLFYDWGCGGSYGSTPMTIDGNGTWTNGEGYNGAWAESAGMLLFQFANSQTTYGGNVASGSITGIQSTFAGLSGCFYMLHESAPTALEERRAEAADSSGGA